MTSINEYTASSRPSRITTARLRVRDIIMRCRDVENRSSDVTPIVIIHEEEVWRATPIIWRKKELV